jgi:hypothetical protein
MEKGKKRDWWILAGITLVMLYFGIGVIDGIRKVRAQEKVKICTVPQVPCSSYQVSYYFNEETITYSTNGATCNYFDMPSGRWLNVWIRECDSTMIWIGQWDGWMQSYTCLVHPIVGEGVMVRQFIFKRKHRSLPTYN